MEEFWRRKREDRGEGRKTAGSICRRAGGEGGENAGITTLERGSANQRPGSSGRPWSSRFRHRPEPSVLILRECTQPPRAVWWNQQEWSQEWPSMPLILSGSRAFPRRGWDQRQLAWHVCLDPWSWPVIGRRGISGLAYRLTSAAPVCILVEPIRRPNQINRLARLLQIPFPPPASSHLLLSFSLPSILRLHLHPSNSIKPKASTMARTKQTARMSFYFHI